MLHDNLKMLRKAKRLPQEEVADALHVVRQTFSKWEKGLSVPDAEMLTRIAELFEVSVGDLLGEITEPTTDRDIVAEQLARINEHLAIKNRRAKRIWQIIIASILTINLITLGSILLLRYDPKNSTTKITETKEEIRP